MFSPAECQLTPCALMRGPRSASPGHRWERPQPGLSICRLCACALAMRPLDSLYAGRPWLARSPLTCASSCCTRPEPAGGGAGLGLPFAFGVAGVGGDADSQGLPAAEGSVEGAADPSTVDDGSTQFGTVAEALVRLAVLAQPALTTRAANSTRRGRSRRIGPP